MTQMEIMKRVEEIGIVPVVKLDDPERDAKSLGQALVDGGVPVAEVTFRAAGAEKAIAIMAKEFPEMIVGAGTVLTVAQAEAAKAAGAVFVVSPGYIEEVMDYCTANDLIYFPGCITPTEICHAYNKGLRVLKFFPAEQAGGLKFIEAVCSAIGDLRFMPTGGVGLKNLDVYIASKSIVACGGSYMVKADLINDGRWDEITDLCKKSRAIIDKVRGN